MFAFFYFAYWVTCIGWWISIPFGLLFFWWFVTLPERSDRRRRKEIAEYIDSGDYEADMERIGNKNLRQKL